MNFSSPDVYKVLMKSKRIRTASIERALFEGSLSILLVEQLDKGDIEKVNSAIGESYAQLGAVLEYFNSLKDFDTSKIPSVMSYLNDMLDALKKAQTELAAASFESGTLSTFMGQKVTLPQIAQAAITIQTKAFDFGSGFSKSVQNIEDSLSPLIKEEDRETPLKDLAGKDGVPDENTIRSGIKKSMTKSFGGGFAKKVSSFFSKSLTGAEKKILAVIPDFKPEELAEEVANAFMESPFKSFFETEIPEPDETATTGLGSVAEEAQEQEESQAQPEEQQDKVEDPPPASNEKEASQEQDQAQQELTNAIRDEAAEAQSPAEAALGAIDSWVDSLSKTSQTSLKAKNRIGSLKDVVKVGLDDASKAVEAEVARAIQSWREANEETLLKSKRFAKKNFDSLQDLIPKLAASMLKKTNESTFKMTKQTINKVVYEFLNRRFYKNTHNNILSETKYTENEMVAYRLSKLAGLKR